MLAHSVAGRTSSASNALSRLIQPLPALLLRSKLDHGHCSLLSTNPRLTEKFRGQEDVKKLISLIFRGFLTSCKMYADGSAIAYRASWRDFF
jgi:hypothetical protein